MGLRKTDRGCFGTRQFSSRSPICLSCPDNKVCNKARLKNKQVFIRELEKI